MIYIVSISGGLGSLEAAKRSIEKYGKENVRLVFADVKGIGQHDWLKMPTISKLLHERFGGESRDTYKFLWDISYHLDMPIERIEDSRSIWDIFYDSKALRLVIGGGKTFFCPASEKLKRQVIVDWCKDNFEDYTYTLVLGMAWDEAHRLKRAEYYWRKQLGWDIDVISPNMEKPYATNARTTVWLNEAGIELPSAYAQGFSHNNCGGGCVQAGQGHFANLYHVRPDVYEYWAWMEYQIQKAIGKPYTILKITRGGQALPVSLYDFVDYIKRGDYQSLDFAGCACFTNTDTAIELSKPKPIQQSFLD